jgi:hypothetical protein
MSKQKIGGIMEKPIKTIVVKLDLEIYKKIKALAQEEKRALQRQAEILLEKSVEEVEKK